MVRNSYRDFERANARATLRSLRPRSRPRLKEAAAALSQNRTEIAERLLSTFLEKHPEDTDALYLLADAAMRLGRFEVAEALLARCVERAPDFDAARFAYARVLHRQGKSALAESHLEKLLKRDPRNLLYLDLQSLVLTAAGKHAESLACYRTLVAACPQSGEFGIRLGHALRTVGLREQSNAAYRSVIRSSPMRGDAYWSLASLKGFRFTCNEIDSMQAVLARSDLSSENRVYLHFALGRALGDFAQWETSFENYAKANAIRRMNLVYDVDSTTERASAIRRLFSPAYIHARAGVGCASPEPIFVFGMQRSGSTLVEQILASHSAVEGAGELSDIPLLAARIESRAVPDAERRSALDTLDAAGLRNLGELYLESTRRHRHLGRPFFVDKQPFNFWHVGVIHLMLPNAKLVDLRRHPIACCFSNFSTLLLHGQGFTHRQNDLGRYYCDYVDAMTHFDRVLPGKIHRVCYERLVAEPESEIRRLLEYLELPFEEGCLRFYDNGRAIDSASSEQVRTRILTDAVNRWRNYEPWLGPLKQSLGPVLETWTEAPPSKC